MGRQVVVIEPSPERKPRDVVVVRKGPPARGGNRRDILVGAIGAVLLIVAILLFSVLPQAEQPLPQYEVAYAESIDESLDLQTAEVAQGAAATFTFPHDGDFARRIEIGVTFEDDLGTTLADAFQVRLLAPDGTVAAGPLNISNPEPLPAGGVPPTFTSRAAVGLVIANLAERPGTEILTAAGPDETLAQVEARARAAAVTNSSGDWSLQVSLLDAGDCPAAQGFDLSRATACAAETSGRDPQDPDQGNRFDVVRVTFISYEPQVRLLE